MAINTTPGHVFNFRYPVKIWFGTNEDPTQGGLFKWHDAWTTFMYLEAVEDPFYVRVLCPTGPGYLRMDELHHAREIVSC